MWAAIVPQSGMLGTLVCKDASDWCVQAVASGKTVALVWVRKSPQIMGNKKGLGGFYLEIDNQRTQEAIWIM